ncbi:Chemotaxis protein [Azospirillaceae bacterium]
MATPPILTGHEVSFSQDEIIVSKTDKTGKITYVNDIFIRVSGYTESDVLYKPHNIIRHPHMPRAVFKLLWETIESGQEIFSYVVNRTKNGDHYWVFAHITPNFDKHGQIIGYHSSRRVARPSAISNIQSLYQKLLSEEQRHPDYKSGINASYHMLHDTIKRQGFDGYDRFIFSV